MNEIEPKNFNAEVDSKKAALAKSGSGLKERMVKLGLPDTWEIKITTNRIRMVSFRGQKARIQGGFIGADDETIKSLVDFLHPPQRGGRKSALPKIREYFLKIPKKKARVEKIKLSSRETKWLLQLKEDHTKINAELFEGRLRPIDIRIGKRMKRGLGYYRSAENGSIGQISISRRHLNRDSWEMVRDTLIHEMLHQWQDENNRPVDHGREWRAEAKRLGIEARAVCRDYR